MYLKEIVDRPKYDGDIGRCPICDSPYVHIHIPKHTISKRQPQTRAFHKHTYFRQVECSNKHIFFMFWREMNYAKTRKFIPRTNVISLERLYEDKT